MKSSMAAESTMPYKIIEERMVKYQRECDERVRREVEAEVNRFKELELSQLRLQESAKYREKIDEFQNELDSIHQEKIKELKLREREVLTRVREKERQVESAAFEHRQKVIKDLEMLRMKESEMKKTVELELMAIKTERENCQAKIKDADLKHKELERLRIALERRTETEIEDFKKSWERDHQHNQIQFDAKRRQLEEDTHIFNMQKDQYLQAESQREKLDKECKELREARDKYQTELNEIKDQLRAMSQNALRDSEIISSKKIEAESSTNEARTYKKLLEDTQSQFEKEKAGLNQLVANLKD